MEMTSGYGCETHGVARVGRYLRPVEDYVKHFGSNTSAQIEEAQLGVFDIAQTVIVHLDRDDSP